MEIIIQLIIMLIALALCLVMGEWKAACIILAVSILGRTFPCVNWVENFEVLSGIINLIG